MKIDQSIYNIDEDPLFQNTILNDNPLFIDQNIWDFRLDSLSPALNYGKLEIAEEVPLDIDGNARPKNAPYFNSLVLKIQILQAKN